MELLIMHLPRVDYGLTVYPALSEYIIANLWSGYKVNIPRKSRGIFTLSKYFEAYSFPQVFKV